MIAAFLLALTFLLALGAITWIVSLIKRDASIIDGVWSLLFVIAAVVYAFALPAMGPRTSLVFTLLLAWALRLSIYITWRNWGEPEDGRYQAIRARNQPHYAIKSLFYVFSLQATLAWIASTPLLGAIASPAPLNLLDAIGAALAAAGIAYETLADWQLARFKADPTHRGQVMDRGLWRHSRHPNYFGEFCVWWGFFLIALAAGAWWSVVGPLLISFLLLKVSGVRLLEQNISERRPAYRDYIARTNAFFPGARKQVTHG